MLARSTLVLMSPDQIGLEIEVLDQGQGIVGTGSLGVRPKDFLRAVAVDLAPETIVKSFACASGHAGSTRNGNRPRRRFAPCPQRSSWRGTCAAPSPPSGKRARAGQTAAGEYHAAERAQSLFHQVQAITAITAKSLVAAIAGEGHRHMFARQLADAVGRNRRAVGIGFVVQPGQRVDQIEVVAGDEVTVMVGPVAVGDLLGEGGFVERGVVEGNRTGVDWLCRLRPGHQGDDGTRIDAAGEKRAERHFGDHPQANRLAELLVQLRTGFGQRAAAVETEAHVPVLPRLSHRQPATQRQRVGRRQLSGLTEDRPRLGHVAEREVFLDRQRVDVARQSAMRQQRLELGAEDKVPSGSSA
jgi:hypothetical protein